MIDKIITEGKCWKPLGAILNVSTHLLFIYVNIFSLGLFIFSHRW